MSQAEQLKNKKAGDLHEIAGPESPNQPESTHTEKDTGTFFNQPFVAQLNCSLAPLN